MERDYAAILHPIIDPLIEKPESVLIRELPGGSRRDVTILIVSESEDTARLIGRRGMVANALREVIGIASKVDGTNQRIHLKFESFGEEETGEGE
ncbi:MAG: KH domain-containing protein [Bacilli bacterium]|nr:KH domain-containing protein [Bacilli bacterium]